MHLPACLPACLPVPPTSFRLHVQCRDAFPGGVRTKKNDSFCGQMYCGIEFESHPFTLHAFPSPSDCLRTKPHVLLFHRLSEIPRTAEMHGDRAVWNRIPWISRAIPRVPLQVGVPRYPPTPCTAELSPANRRHAPGSRLPPRGRSSWTGSHRTLAGSHKTLE
jgi:hypothetical protein